MFVRYAAMGVRSLSVDLIRASAPPSRGLCSPAGLASFNARSRCATLAARLGCDDGAPTGRGCPPESQRAVLRDDNVEVVVAEALAILRGGHPTSVLRAASQRHVVDAEQSGQVVR